MRGISGRAAVVGLPTFSLRGTDHEPKPVTIELLVRVRTAVAVFVD